MVKKLTEQEREKLHEKLKGFDDAAAKLREARKPFDDALMVVETLKEELLEEHEADVAGSCLNCGKLLLVGELGHDHEDAGPSCVECSPTWDAIKKEYDEAAAKGELADWFDSPAAAQMAHDYANEMVATGKGAERHVWEL